MDELLNYLLDNQYTILLLPATNGRVSIQVHYIGPARGMVGISAVVKPRDIYSQLENLVYWLKRR